MMWHLKSLLVQMVILKATSILENIRRTCSITHTLYITAAFMSQIGIDLAL
jgi:hypothetical protein